jgi:uncharacterized cupin superfamily protein
MMPKIDIAKVPVQRGAGRCPMRFAARRRSCRFQSRRSNGRQLVNRSQRDAAFIVVGTRASLDRVRFPDEGLADEYGGTSFTFMHKSGEPYTK